MSVINRFNRQCHIVSLSYRDIEIRDPIQRSWTVYDLIFVGWRSWRINHSMATRSKSKESWWHCSKFTLPTSVFFTIYIYIFAYYTCQLRGLDNEHWWIIYDQLWSYMVLFLALLFNNAWALPSRRRLLLHTPATKLRACQGIPGAKQPFPAHSACPEWWPGS